MIRLVRVFGASVEIDVAGKKPGRGAYLCRVLSCWETGLKGGRLEHVLKTTLTRAEREQLIKSGKEFLGRESSDESQTAG